MIFERAYLGLLIFISSVDVMIKGVTPRKYSTISSNKLFDSYHHDWVFVHMTTVIHIIDSWDLPDQGVDAMRVWRYDYWTEFEINT